MISIDEFAKQCGVSKATASRAFKEYSPINADTRETILRKAEELGYKPKEYNKRVDTATGSRLIGVMIGMASYPYANDICMAVSDILENAGFIPLFLNNQNGDNSEIRLLNAVKDMISGLIIVPSSTQNEYNAKFIKQLSKKIPVIFLIRRIPDVNVDSITIKNYSGVINATRLLLDHGHKNIGFFTGPMNITPSHDKLTGYTDALKRYDVPVNGDYICYGEHNIRKTADQVQDLLTRHPEITALITSNIIMTRGVLLGIEHMHLSVPDNVSIVSYGNDTLMSVGKSKISCIYDYHYDVGVQAANLLLRRLRDFTANKKYEPEQISVNPELIIRGSEVFPTRPIVSLKSKKPNA